MRILDSIKYKKCRVEIGPTRPTDILAIALTPTDPGRHPRFQHRALRQSDSR